MATEYGWCLESGEASNPLYLSVKNKQFIWTPYHFKALRLARRQDAEMLSSIVLEDVSRIAEHAWDTRQAADDPTERAERIANRMGATFVPRAGGSA